jgi:ABC-type amino acid transport substrate-binding protein
MAALRATMGTTLAALLLIVPALAAAAPGRPRAAGPSPRGDAAARSASVPRVVVGTTQLPPFAMKEPDGAWTGLAIELWRDIASALGVESEYREYDLAGLLGAVRAGQVDIAVTGLTMTPEESQRLSFSPPYYASGIAIAVRLGESGGWEGALWRVLSPGVLGVVAWLVALLLGAGILVWLLERRRNDRDFGGSAAEGIGAGFWWSAVTMTGVGYGDKTPRTVPGRLVALVWMFASLVLVATFTAAITSALTVSQLQPSVRGLIDLPHVRVGTVPGTAVADFLRTRQIAFVGFPSPRDGLRALAEGQLAAFVGEDPILRYWVRQDHPGHVTVLPKLHDTEYYGLAVPLDSDLRARVFPSVLTMTRAPRWAELLSEYLGAGPQGPPGAGP